MPPQSRSQRRRQAARQQQPRRAAPPRPVDAEVEETGATGPTITLGAPSSAAAEARRAEARPATRPARRVLSRSAPEPVDYSKDYAAVRWDLRRIVIWTVLLFAAMVALKFSGLV
jgi:hypothetical protein